MTAFPSAISQVLSLGLPQLSPPPFPNPVAPAYAPPHPHSLNLGTPRVSHCGSPLLLSQPGQAYAAAWPTVASLWSIACSSKEDGGQREHPNFYAGFWKEHWAVDSIPAPQAGPLGLSCPGFLSHYHYCGL